MIARSFVLLALALLGSARTAGAVEKVPASMVREQATAGLDQPSLKPLVVFGMRGRPDPFMAYSVLTRTASPELANITMLSFGGTIEVGGSVVAMFRDMNFRTYVMKGDQLFGPEGKVIPGIQGSLVPGGVVLQQGERKINYITKSNSKRLGPAANR